jgi:hypothetical protein
MKNLTEPQRKALEEWLVSNIETLQRVAVHAGTLGWSDLLPALDVLLAEVKASASREVPQGTHLHEGSWYRITRVSKLDPEPGNAVGDVLQAKYSPRNGELDSTPKLDYWVVSGQTMVTGLEEVDPP